MKFSEIPQLMQDGNWECNYQLGSIARVVEEWQQESGLQLKPDFQRGHVWTRAQQTAYVEYALRGGRSGLTIYFNQPSWQRVASTPYNDFVCVDGLQRLTALQLFLAGQLPAFGQLFHEFGQSIRLAPNVTGLRFNVNNLQTKAEVLTWYLQMNDGGTPHTAEEIARIKAMLQAEKEGE